MFKALFFTLYNAFIFLIDFLPFDAGIVVIIFTGIVSVALFPLSKKALATQAKTKLYEAELNALKEKYKNNKEEQARKLLAFYKEKGINPLSSLFLTLIQLPVIIALYYVFYKSGLPDVDATQLYSFVPKPESVNMIFLGLIDLTQKSFFLAIIAAAAQFTQGWFSPALSAQPKKRQDGAPPSFEESFMTSMRIQTRYILPGIIFLISYQYSGVIALYFATRSMFMFGQELVMKKRTEKTANE